jgi:hypothetical protein
MDLEHEEALRVVYVHYIKSWEKKGNEFNLPTSVWFVMKNHIIVQTEKRYGRS